VRRDMSAHEHGRWTLDIAVENSVIWMGLEVPGADIVGFEHKAETAADREAVEAALAVLRQPLGLFTLPDDAGCTVVQAEAEFHGGGGEEEHEDEYWNEDEHSHDDHEHEDEYWNEDEHEHEDAHEDEHEHEDAHEDEHEHEDAHEDAHEDEHEHEDAHEDEHEHEEVHGGFEAEYVLNCAAPGAIDRMAFPYFDLFAGAEALVVTIVSARGQALLEVERGAPALDVAGRF